MLLYLRHGDDRGEDAYKHDRALNARGRKKAEKAFEALVDRYGHPDTLFVSPYRRAVQTLEAMKPRFARPVDIHRDPRVAQYVGGKRVPVVSPETAAVVDIDETLAQFRARVADHAEDARRRAKAGAVLWCITHQVVVEEVARHFGLRVPSELDFLDHVVVRPR